MTAMMSLVAALALGQLPLGLPSLPSLGGSGAPNTSVENPLETKKREKQDLIDKLRRDIFKVDRSLGETEKLISKSRNAPYCHGPGAL